MLVLVVKEIRPTFVQRGKMDTERDPATPGFEPSGASGAGIATAHSGRTRSPVSADGGEPDLPRTSSNSASSAERVRKDGNAAWFNELYLLAPAGYFVVGFDGKILQVNLSGARMLGIARANPGRHRLRSFVEAGFLAVFDQFIRHAVNCDAPEQCRLVMTLAAPAGAAAVTLHGSADGSGQACRVVLEQTEGKLDALARSEERFRRIVHSAEEGIWEVDAATITTFVNPKMAEILSCTIEEMLDRPLDDFMDDEGKAILEHNVARRRQGIAERHEFKFIDKNGRPVWTSMATNPIFNAAGAYLGALALVTDITERRASAALVWRQANFDELTGLPNRHMFLDRLAQEMRKADRGAAFLALLFLDLDHFKEVNDQYGHATGDALLVQAAHRIAACVRGSDTLARLGGDEFTVILAGLDHVGGVERIAQSLVETLARPFELGAERIQVSSSVGIALYPPDATEVGELLARADQAMYASKSAGRGRFSYFTPDLQEAALTRQRMASDLREAINARQFEIVYQPIVSLRTGAVCKAEALLRWRHPTRGLLGAAEFIPFAESSGLIVQIGDWVFREAARQVRRWQRSIDPAFQVSVNKSPVQFRRDEALYAGWIDCLAELGLPPQSIVIEIAEGVLFDGADKVVERLGQYRSMGLQVALEHFGSGYSSLAHLKRFDIDFVKIDQSFVARLESDEGDLALCEAIIVMAHKLGLEVVAEGVETRVQRALLADAGCDFAQGYGFAPPMTAAELEALALATPARRSGPPAQANHAA
jgi:diguanylate cyclase (GGDEF)-like protein/PAS domain S-box-containing protein